MKIIEITPLENGARRNQTLTGAFRKIPDDWAIIPDGMTIPDTFPFVDIAVEGQTVVSMTAGIMPEPEPVKFTPSAQDDMDAMLVDHEYRLTLLELGVTEEV